MAKTKIGRNKKACEKYKLSGHRDENKRLRQKQHEKRLARFAKRKEEGKSYKYVSIPYEEGSRAYVEEVNKRAAKNVDRRLPINKWKSIMRKVDDAIAKEMALIKEQERARKNAKRSQ